MKLLLAAALAASALIAPATASAATVEVIAQPGSGMGIHAAGWGSSHWEYHPLDDSSVARIDDSEAGDREMITRCLHGARSDLIVSTQRLAFGAVRVSMTARLFWGCGREVLLAEEELRPVTLAQRQTVAKSYTIGTVSQDGTYAKAKLILANRFAPETLPVTRACVLNCGVKVRAEQPSWLQVVASGVTSYSTETFTLDRMPVALLGPDVTEGRKLVVRCLSWTCAELTIDTHRVAGGAVEVSTTARLFGGFGSAHEEPGPTSTLAPLTIPPGATVEQPVHVKESSPFGWIKAEGSLRLSNTVL